MTLVLRVTHDSHGTRIRAHLQQGSYSWLIVNASPSKRPALWRGVVHGLEAMAIGNGWTFQMTGGPKTPPRVG